MRTPALLLVTLSAAIASAQGTPDAGPPLSEEGLPWVGAGDDPWGVPVRTADRLALRKLLVERRFAELDAALERFDAIATRDGCRRELVSVDAFGAFKTADPALRPHLDAWVQATPERWPAVLARGRFLSAMAVEQRGVSSVRQTSAARLKEMKRFAALARVDLDQSMQSHPTVTATLALLRLDQLEGAEAGAHLAGGLAVCPASFEVHQQAMALLRPEWGGSVDAMMAFASRAPEHLNPKLKVLRGAVASRECSGRNLAACDEALAAGRYWLYLQNKAFALGSREAWNPKAGLPLIDEALRQRPQSASLLAVRALLLEQLRRDAEALRVRRQAATIDAFEPFLH